MSFLLPSWLSFLLPSWLSSLLPSCLFFFLLPFWLSSLLPSWSSSSLCLPGCLLHCAFLVVFSTAFFTSLPNSLLSLLFLLPSLVYLPFSFCLCSRMALLLSCSFFFCSFSSAASFWHPFSSNWVKHSALVRRHARGRVFGPASVEEVSSTRYLDMGEIDFPESGVSDGWRGHVTSSKNLANLVFQTAGHLTASQNRHFRWMVVIENRCCIRSDHRFHTIGS